MAGRYWHIGSTCGVPVYRQEAGATPHDYELVLVHVDGEASGVPKLRSMRGWFIVKGDVLEALMASQDAAQVAMCGSGPDPKSNGAAQGPRCHRRRTSRFGRRSRTRASA